MSATLTLSDISIRTELRAGDLGYLTWLHGTLYHREYQYGLSFEAYVAAGLHEFVLQYRPERNRVWVCEYENKMVGFLLLMDRGEAAQLRYFLICPEYRGLGLGRQLLTLFLDFLRESGYRKAYLWTTHEQEAAAALYKSFGFKLTEEKESNAFGKPLREQRYDLVL
jgi:ribosomal protein S18 acetylase RimI-like enzyme